jgi:hypothetical protein
MAKHGLEKRVSGVQKDLSLQTLPSARQANVMD